MDKKPKPPRIYECKEKQEAICQETPHIEKFDPRSYCHNILAKTEKICKRKICRKFLKTNEQRTRGEIVCIPRPPCKMKRHFGPVSDSEEDDDDKTFFRMFGSQLGLILDEGTVSETDILRGKFEGPNRVTRDGRHIGEDEYEDVIDEYGNVIRRRKGGIRGKPGAGGRQTQFGIVQDAETEELLENLSKFLDAEGMAAIAALGGAEICPCCQCRLCKCKLRGISSEMLLAQRKKALLESKLKSWGKSGYVWSFDYYYKPDFEFFEKEREERQKREEMLIHETKEKHITDGKSKEEYSTEESGKEKRELVGVQATPSIREAEVQIRSEMLDVDSLKSEKEAMEEKMSLEVDWSPTAGKIPDFGQVGIPGISLHLGEKGTLTGSSKTIDNIGISYVRSTQRSSIESWVETREPFPKDRRPTTVTGASIEPIDPNFPFAEIQGVVRLLSKESIETETKPSVPSGKKKERKKPKAKKEQKDYEIDLHTPVLKILPKRSDDSHIFELTGQSDVDESIAEGLQPVKVPLLSVEHKKSSMSSADLEELKLSVDTKTDAITTKASTKKIPTTSSKRRDVCDCLPGFCTCGSKHFVFKKVDVGIEKKPLTEAKTIQAEDVKKASEGKATESEDISTQSSCICYHPWEDIDELAKITPAQSIRIDTVQAVKKPKIGYVCPQPTYQKTVIIVKPEAMSYKDVIIRAIKTEGLDIIDERLVQLSPEQVAEVYSENYGSAYFPMFVQKMSSTPILILAIAGKYAVDRWKYIIGQGEVIPSSWFYPESIKRRFGMHCDIYGAMRTSANFFTAKNEIRYFFPLDIIDPIIIDSIEVQDYCDTYIHPTLLKALHKIIIDKPEDPLLFLAEWLLQNNPFQPHYVDTLVAIAPT